MYTPNCQVNDYCVVIDAINKENIGSIVKVIYQHQNQFSLCPEQRGFIWEVESFHPLTYLDGNGEIFHSKTGPMPDDCLHRIHGLYRSPDIALMMVSLMDFEIASCGPRKHFFTSV
jgi:hypothetical protein